MSLLEAFLPLAVPGRKGGALELQFPRSATYYAVCSPNQSSNTNHNGGAGHIVISSCQL